MARDNTSARSAGGRFVVSEESLERDAEAFRMRARQCTYEEIAIALGYGSRGNVSVALNRHIKRIVKPSVDEYRAVMDAQLDEMHRAVLRVLETTHLKVNNGVVVYYSELDEKGNPTGPERALKDDAPVLAAVDRMLKIQERRAKLFGLDAPTQVVAEVKNVTVRIEGAEDV